MLRFLKNKKQDILLGLFFLIIGIVSCTVMPRLTPAELTTVFIRVRIDILLGSVISLSLLKGRKYASYYAVTVGFLYDLIVGNPYAFSPVVYFLCAWFAPKAAAPFSSRTPITAALTAGMLVWIKSIFSFFYLIAVWKSVDVMRLITRAVLPEYLLNIAAAFLMFALLRIFMAIFRIPVRETSDL